MKDRLKKQDYLFIKSVAIQCNPNQFLHNNMVNQYYEYQSFFHLFKTTLPKQEILSNFALYYKDNPMKNDKELKTITIRQGSGDDALEMTVQVTQEEFEKMEEFRSKNPQKWPEYSLELVKAARDTIENPKTNIKHLSYLKSREWPKAALGILIVMMGLFIYWLCFRGPNTYYHDRELLGLKGPVKSLLTIDFDVDEEFAQDLKVVGSPQLGNANYKSFDSTGNTHENITIKIAESHLNKYKKLDYLGSFTQETIYDNEKRTKVNEQNTYNSDGNLIVEKKYCKDGRVFSQSIHEYNDKKNETKCSYVNYLNPQFSYDTEWSYTYDNNGKPLTKTEYYSDGSVNSITNYVYDQFGRVIKETFRNCPYDNRGKPIQKPTIETEGFFEIEKTNQYLKNEFIYTENTKWNNPYKRLIEKSSEVDHWWYDTANNRNDNHFLRTSEDGSVSEYKYSLYYDSDSVYYLEKKWDKNSELEYVNHIQRIKSPHDSIVICYFDDFSLGIDVTNCNNEKSQTKSYNTQSEIQSKELYQYTEPQHFSVVKNNSVVKFITNKKGRIETTEEKFDDGKTTFGKYSYKGNNKKWQEIIEYQNEAGDKSTTMKTYFHNLLTRMKDTDGISYEYEYNNKNELILYKASLGQECSFSDYIYDKHGNWIRRSKYNVSDGTYTITARCIEYY